MCVCIAAIDCFAQAPGEKGAVGQTNPNLVHQSFGPFEYLIEERTGAQNATSRVYLLPSVETLEQQVIEGDGEAKSSVRLVVSLAPPMLDQWTKALIVAHAENLEIMHEVPSSQEFLKQPTSDPIVQGDIVKRLIETTKEAVKLYRFDSCLPRSLEFSVYVAGRLLAHESIGSGVVVGTHSTFELTCKDVTTSEQKAIQDGRYSIRANMELDVSRLQIAASTVRLVDVFKTLTNDIIESSTAMNEDDNAVFMWKKVQRSLATVASSAQFEGIDAARRFNATLFSRDVTSDVLIDKAFNLIYFPAQPLEIGLDSVIANHRAAMTKAEGALKEAHKQYSAYLSTLKPGAKPDQNAAKDAVTALASYLKSSGGGGSEGGTGAGTQAGGSAGASSGNGYLAAAAFIANGIAIKKEGTNEKMQILVKRSAEITTEDERSFNGIIATQATAHYLSVRSIFPKAAEPK